MKKVLFRDTANNIELVLPVTPDSFEVSHGINIETVNIHTLGDVAVPGYGTLPTFNISCMFPAREYNFIQPGAGLEPYSYVQRFEWWSGNKTILRLVVSETQINKPVLISDIRYGEQDGTGDVYATITLREYRQVAVVQVANTGNLPRPVTEVKKGSVQSYTIKPGDTLSAICRKYYGNSSLYSKLAAYNNVKNPNLIYAGNTLKLPDKSAM